MPPPLRPRPQGQAGPARWPHRHPTREPSLCPPCPGSSLARQLSRCKADVPGPAVKVDPPCLNLGSAQPASTAPRALQEGPDPGGGGGAGAGLLPPPPPIPGPTGNGNKRRKHRGPPPQQPRRKFPQDRPRPRLRPRLRPARRPLPAERGAPARPRASTNAGPPRPERPQPPGPGGTGSAARARRGRWAPGNPGALPPRDQRATCPRARRGRRAPGVRPLPSRPVPGRWPR